MKTKTKEKKTKKCEQPVATDAAAPADAAVAEIAEVVNDSPASGACDAVTGDAATSSGVSSMLDTAAHERLHHLEQKFKDKMQAANKVAAEAIEIILKIRDERLYKADGYETFDEYMDAKWGYSRQWVEQMQLRLRMTSICQARLGVGPDEVGRKFELTVHDAGLLRPLQDDPDVLVAAVEEYEAEKPKAKNCTELLKQLVKKWQRFQTVKDQDDGEALTPEEWQVLAQLPHHAWGSDYLYLLPPYRARTLDCGKTLVEAVQEKVEADKVPLDRALMDVCEELRCIPCDDQLLQLARGESLNPLVHTLAAMVDGWKLEDKAKTAAAKAQVEAEAESDEAEDDGEAQEKEPTTPPTVEVAKMPEQKPRSLHQRKLTSFSDDFTPSAELSALLSDELRRWIGSYDADGELSAWGIANVELTLAVTRDGKISGRHLDHLDDGMDSPYLDVTLYRAE